MRLVMIVDKNPEDALHLQKSLMEIEKDLAFVLFFTGEDAVTYLENSRMVVDIFFIEKELPAMSGFSFAEKIRDKGRYHLTPLIFVTEGEEDPLEAYQRFHCYSYIKKPFSKETFRQQIQSLFCILDESKPTVKANMNERTIMLETIEEKESILVKDIVSLEVYGNNCTIYTKHKKYRLKRCSLMNKLLEINEKFILRCHKSYGINVRYIKGWKKKDRNLWEPIYHENVNAPCLISRTYYEDVKSAYEQFRHGDKNANAQR